MIVGEYKERISEVTIDLTVIGPNGNSGQITAVIDTGFTGYLILPERLALELRLAALPEHELFLADGSVTRLPRYSAEIVWDERKRTVPVYASRGGPLIGMKCLRKHLVTMELIPEGSITIERAV